MRNCHATIDRLKRQLLGELAYKLNTEQMTVSEMALRIGVSTGSLSEIMRNRRTFTLDWVMNALLLLGHDLTVVIK